MSFYEQLKTRLDAVHDWPSIYVFKFVVAQDQREALLKLVPIGKIEEKLSRTGKYISVSIKAHIASSDAVIQVYERTSRIEGIVTL